MEFRIFPRSDARSNRLLALIAALLLACHAPRATAAGGRAPSGVEAPCGAPASSAGSPSARISDGPSAEEVGSEVGSGDATAAPASEVPVDPAPERLRRVVVIGASASDGFFNGANLAQAFDPLIAGAHEPVTERADYRFFLRPRFFASSQLDWAAAQDPTLILGVDFLFWLGYGELGGESARLALLEWGLESLERFDCPLVLSTLPDVRDASALMLREVQKPTDESLAALNARIREWAAGRPNIVLISLGELLDTWRRHGSMRIGGVDWPGWSGLTILQWDRLHPTLAGLSGLACHVGEVLIERELVPADALKVDPAELHAELFRRQLAELARRREERLRARLRVQELRGE